MTEVALHNGAAHDADTAGTVRLAAAGDEAAFDRLVSQHHTSMAKVAFVICGDEDVARDAVQNAWAMAWRRLGSVRDPGQIRSWLLVIAGNEARQALRRRRLRPVVDISPAIERAAGHSQDFAELIDLQRALAQLKPVDRQLLALRFVAGYDSTEIARMVGGSASGVRSRLARLIERLRKDLSDG